MILSMDVSQILPTCFCGYPVRMSGHKYLITYTTKWFIVLGLIIVLVQLKCKTTHTIKRFSLLTNLIAHIIEMLWGICLNTLSHTRTTLNHKPSWGNIKAQ